MNPIKYTFRASLSGRKYSGYVLSWSTGFVEDEGFVPIGVCIDKNSGTTCRTMLMCIKLEEIVSADTVEDILKVLWKDMISKQGLDLNTLDECIQREIKDSWRDKIRILLFRKSKWEQWKEWCKKWW